MIHIDNRKWDIANFTKYSLDTSDVYYFGAGRQLSPNKQLSLYETNRNLTLRCQYSDNGRTFRLPLFTYLSLLVFINEESIPRHAFEESPSSFWRHTRTRMRKLGPFPNLQHPNFDANYGLLCYEKCCDSDDFEWRKCPREMWSNSVNVI